MYGIIKIIRYYKINTVKILKIDYIVSLKSFDEIIEEILILYHN